LLNLVDKPLLFGERREGQNLGKILSCL